MSDTIQKYRLGLVPFGIVLALGFVFAAGAITDTLQKIKGSQDMLTVKGYAEKLIVSDVAVWGGQYVARAEDLIDAYTRLERDRTRVFSFLVENGVMTNQVKFSTVKTAVDYRKNEKGNNTNQIEGYRLSQRFEITSGDVRLLEQLATTSGVLIRDGIEFSSSEPAYMVTRLNDYKIGLLGEATRNARERAEQLAKNSNCAVGSLRYASQGVFQITPVNSTDVSDYGTYDTHTIDKNMKAVVTIHYSLER